MRSIFVWLKIGIHLHFVCFISLNFYLYIISRHPFSKYLKENIQETIITNYDVTPLFQISNRLCKGHSEHFHWRTKKKVQLDHFYQMRRKITQKFDRIDELVNSFIQMSGSMGEVSLSPSFKKWKFFRKDFKVWSKSNVI